MAKCNHINDTVHGLIELTKYEKHILGTAGFNRLHDVYQNSTVYLTFPTNRTKRFEHSIGTMKLASDMFLNSIKNTDDAIVTDILRIFKQAIEDVCIAQLEEEQAIIRGEKLPRGTQSIRGIPKVDFDVPLHLLIPANVDPKYHDCFLVLLESVRVAALLHDVGHPPYSHIVESAMREVYNQAKMENADAYLQQYKKRLDPYFSDKAQLHEQMGLEISRSILLDVIPGKSQNTINPDEKIFRFIVRECVTCMYENRYPFTFLHDIVEGTLDADRLDYVTRDPLASGLHVGSIDYSRIFSNMVIYLDITNVDADESLGGSNEFVSHVFPPEMGRTDVGGNIKNESAQNSPMDELQDNMLITDEKKARWEKAPFYFGKTYEEIKEEAKKEGKDSPKVPDYIKFCNPMKSMHSIEDFLSRRFDLYKNIILHHHVVKTDALLEGAVVLMIKGYLKEHNGDLNGVNQYIASDISGLWFPLGKNITPDEKEDALSQWNDSWLMTCLKQHYYRVLLPQSQDPTKPDLSGDQKVLLRYLDELIFHERKYTSLIKRSGDFIKVDNIVRERVNDKISQISETEYPNISETLKALKEQAPKDDRGFYLAFLEPLFGKLWPDYYGVADPNDELKKELYPVREKLRETILDAVRGLFKKELDTDDDKDVEYEFFVSFNNTKTGIDSPVYFFTKNVAGTQSEERQNTDNVAEEQGSDSTAAPDSSVAVNAKSIDGIDISELHNVSNIERILTLEKNSCPYFFLYVYRDSKVLENNSSTRSMSEKFSQKLGNAIADKICVELASLKSSGT